MVIRGCRTAFNCGPLKRTDHCSHALVVLLWAQQIEAGILQRFSLDATGIIGC